MLQDYRVTKSRAALLLFLIFHLNVITPPFPLLIFSMLITSIHIPSNVPALPHLKTSCSTSFIISWLNFLILKKPFNFKYWNRYVSMWPYRFEMSKATFTSLIFLEKKRPHQCHVKALQSALHALERWEGTTQETLLFLENARSEILIWMTLFFHNLFRIDTQ